MRGCLLVLLVGLLANPGMVLGREPVRAPPGPRLTLKVKAIPVVELLRFLADFAGLNLVAGDEVSGKVTVDLKNVRWHQAFEAVARSRALHWELDGNVLLVTTARQHQRELEARLGEREAMRALAPRKLRVLPVNYARAADLVPQMKLILGEDAKVSVDERTNTLIVLSP